MHNWFNNHSLRVVVINASESCKKGLINRVPQGSVLFNIFISDLHNGIESMLINFADDTKLGGFASALEAWIIIQNNQDKLVNRMKFSTDKCKLLLRKEQSLTHIQNGK